MNGALRSLLVGLCLLAAASAARAEVAVVDDSGATVRLAAPARRIVSLAPDLTETLFAAGAAGRVVGTVEYSDYPEEARAIARVGSYSRIDLERVVALRPDLIVAWQRGNPAAHLERLRAAGIPLYLSQTSRIEDIASSLERLGVLAGSETQARSAAATFRRRLVQLQTRYSDRPPVRTFYQIWKQPLMTVGRSQIISDVIRLCGGENVFAQIEALAAVVSVEAVVAANPEAIVASGMDESRPEWLDDWRRWPAVQAVARSNLFFVPPDLIQRHTPRLLEGAELFCEHLEKARSRRPSR
ncbi:cobalamin-binding protein [Accumulibacter sp.]|uniref:cobalamin-binding protein n=1 Tax=Accumulibacter sp. TaxID=2053492 RepID=UPI0025D003D5|nr:cobalamin-binding protein [Accumulibacter sp.]MCM8596770.1 cobalamin-binding protein [Accumulibacter sp.]MCM8624696.1 cobalamin-binding protein [Accumulibacter sp.]MDS4050918.1 cobalamin-binding protein [Accumulibacter sp.]